MLLDLHSLDSAVALAAASSIVATAAVSPTLAASSPVAASVNVTATTAADAGAVASLAASATATVTVVVVASGSTALSSTIVATATVAADMGASASLDTSLSITAIAAAALSAAVPMSASASCTAFISATLAQFIPPQRQPRDPNPTTSRARVIYPTTPREPDFDVETLTNLTLWLRSGTGVTTSGGKFSAWADGSSDGHDASQGTPSSRPTSVIVNSREVPDFAGAEKMSCEGTLSDYVSFLGGNLHLFVVFEADTLSDSNTFVYLNNCLIGDSLGYFGLFGKTDSGSGNTYMQAYVTDLTVGERDTPIHANSQVTVGGARHVVEVKLELATNTLSLRLDDKDPVSTSCGLINTLSGQMTLGHGYPSSAYFDGRLLEIIMCKSVQDAGQTTDVRGYLSERHNVDV